MNLRYVRPLLGACLLLMMLGASGCFPAATRPLSFWITSGDDEVLPDTPPSEENDVYSASRARVRLVSAVNETVSLQLCLRGSSGLSGSVNAQVTDLAGASGAIASAANVALFRAHPVRVERFRAWYPDHTGRTALPTEFFDVLVPWDAPRGGGPVSPGESRNELIWIDVHIPPTVEPGEYTGELQLRRGGEKTASTHVSIALRVLPVTIPTTPELPVVCRVDARDLLAEHFRWPRERVAEELRLLPSAANHQPALRLINSTMQLFHEHRLTPALWSCFPKFRPTGERSVEVEWGPYDDLVAPWFDGSAFADGSGLIRCPLPVSLAYPDAERNGGFGSPQYARLLATYLAACRDHFEERGWLDRAVVRIDPPGELTQASLDRMRRLSGIVRQSEGRVPLVAHLPAQSLRGLGWYNAPNIELSDIEAWAPPAMQFEPEAMARERGLGRQTWFMPDVPPYSAPLAVGGRATDPRALAWQAHRYDVDGIWIEHAAEPVPTAAAQAPPDASLVYPGKDYGLVDRPVASIRLKRLRRGLTDYALLKQMEKGGKQLLARTIADRAIRWAFTDACEDNLLTCKETGWSSDASTFALARTMMLQELANVFEPTDEGQAEQIANLAGWGRLMNQAERVRPAIQGVRLSGAREGFRARAFVTLSNRTERALAGAWQLNSPPIGWNLQRELPMTVPAGGRGLGTLDLTLGGIAYNADGAYPFELAFNSEAAGAFAAPARLAVAACPLVDVAPRIDGDLSDWSRAANNSAGGFRLCRGRSSIGGAESAPVRPTQAYFCLDRDRLYVGVQCTLGDGERPLWSTDNIVPMDGIIPWGQDVVELLLSPSDADPGASSELYILQIKPSGLLIGRKGPRTDPPIGPSEEWRSGAVVAVKVLRDAWIVELAVPLDSLGRSAATSRVWGVNVTRLDARRGEYSSWSGARDNCYSPQSLGNLLLLKP